MGVCGDSVEVSADLRSRATGGGAEVACLAGGNAAGALAATPIEAAPPTGSRPACAAEVRVKGNGQVLANALPHDSLHPETEVQQA